MKEHTRSPRIKGSQDDEISYRERLLGRYLSGNFTREGVFLETGPLHLCRSELSLRLSARDTSLHMRERVVHHV